METAPFPGTLWENAGAHQAALLAEQRIFSPLTPALTQLVHPTVLVRGLYDHVFAQDQLREFLRQKPDTRVAFFAKSSHFVHVEEPDEFAQTVSQFVRRLA